MANFPIFDACTLFGPWPQHAADLSLETLLGVMSQNGIARSLATSTAGIFYDYRAGNAATLEARAQHPQQLYPVATLDPRAYPHCVDEAVARAEQGFRLFRFFPEWQRWPLHYAPFGDLLLKCDELSVPVAVTVSRSGDSTRLAENVAFSQSPLLLAGVRSHHLGEVLSVMRAEPKFLLETTHLLAPGALEAVRDGVPNGAQRLIFASYSPLRYLSSALGPILSSTLSDEDKAAVLGGNLVRLLSKG